MQPLFPFPVGETKAQGRDICSWSLGELGVEWSLEIRLNLRPGFCSQTSNFFSPVHS